jgi:hypothetical protein
MFTSLNLRKPHGKCFEVQDKTLSVNLSSTETQSVRPNGLAICDDFHPSKRRSMAAIRIPIQAPGIFSTISNKASRVTDSFFIVNVFMASPPKKVFEHFSEGTMRKTEIYVYLFMTLVIIQKDFITRFPLESYFHFPL